ncbi:elongator complex protein 5 [Cylas formicarius]|uniref:elongator complex protein 5 n=1 Tax=Cylas formicarius TaxID=197179 RepID=UPI002958AF87|nr:elongator complex protein 5 [Cylas formicarius]
MLKSYLTTVPFTKFVLIDDTLKRRSTDLYEYIIRQHINADDSKVHYFVFEGRFQRIRNQYLNKPNTVLYDFVSNPLKWIEVRKPEASFESIITQLGARDVIIVDSLANVIFQYGLSQSYKYFNTLRNKEVQQIITVLHKDLLEEDHNQVFQFFEHLSTLSISTVPKFFNQEKTLSYTYKKSGGRTIQAIEKYRFEGECLVTQKVTKPDPAAITQNISKDVNPETLSTFRIGLTDEEKVLRDKVVLPYLPKSGDEGESKNEGKIYYELDAMDDWDEEDPDDDLDI